MTTRLKVALSIGTILVLTALAAQVVDFSTVLAANTPSTVLLRVEIAGRPPGYGSGYVLDDAGNVLTAKHVVAAAQGKPNSLITGLVGWEMPSVDFSQAIPLAITYVSPRYDLAVLKFDTPFKGAKTTLAAMTIRKGEPVTVMGYPGGNHLSPRFGNVSAPEADGAFSMTAVVGRGISGSPVFGLSGTLLGILTAETGKDTKTGDDRLAQFLGIDAVRDELKSINLPLGFPTFAGGKPAPRPTINPGYPVSETKKDARKTGEFESRTYSKTFKPENGYRISSAGFETLSSARVVGTPAVRLQDAGAAVTVDFTLQTSPVDGQNVAWLTGNVITVQQLRTPPPREGK